MSHSACRPRARRPTPRWSLGAEKTGGTLSLKNTHTAQWSLDPENLVSLGLKNPLPGPQPDNGRPTAMVSAPTQKGRASIVLGLARRCPRGARWAAACGRPFALFDTLSQFFSRSRLTPGVVIVYRLPLTGRGSRSRNTKDSVRWLGHRSLTCASTISEKATLDSKKRKKRVTGAAGQ